MSEDHPLTPHLMEPLLHHSSDADAPLQLSSDSGREDACDIGLDLRTVHSFGSSEFVGVIGEDGVDGLRLPKFELLPDVILFRHVFPFLSRNELLVTAAVCRRWRRICTRDAIWRGHRASMFRSRHTVDTNIFRQFADSHEESQLLVQAPSKKRLLRTFECFVHFGFVIESVIHGLVTVFLFGLDPSESSGIATAVLISWICLWFPLLVLFLIVSIVSILYGTYDWSARREEVVLKYRLGKGARDVLLESGKQIGTSRERVAESAIGGGFGLCLVGVGIGVTTGMFSVAASISRLVLNPAFSIVLVVGVCCIAVAVCVTAGCTVCCAVARRVRAWERGGRCFVGCVLAPSILTCWWVICAVAQCICFAVWEVHEPSSAHLQLFPGYLFCGGVVILFLAAIVCWLSCSFACFACEKKRNQNRALPYPRYITAQGRVEKPKSPPPVLRTFLIGDADYYRCCPMTVIVLLLVGLAILSFIGLLAFFILMSSMRNSDKGALFAFVPLALVVFVFVTLWLVAYCFEVRLRSTGKGNSGLWDWIAQKWLLKKVASVRSAMARKRAQSFGWSL